MKPTAASVLDAIDDVLDSASAARHDAVMADVPDLEPIPGPWDVDTVAKREPAPVEPFTVDEVIYDRPHELVVSRGVAWTKPMVSVAQDRPEAEFEHAEGDERFVLLRQADDLDLIAGTWVGPKRRIDGEKHRHSAFRYSDEGWVW